LPTFSSSCFLPQKRKLEFDLMSSNKKIFVSEKLSLVEEKSQFRKKEEKKFSMKLC